MKKRSRLATGLLLSVLAACGACSAYGDEGYSNEKRYEGLGKVVEYDENHVIIDNITNGKATGGMTAYPRIEVQDAYRDDGCVAREVSDDLDKMIAAGTIAVGGWVQFKVDEGWSQEECIALSNGWPEERILLVSLAPSPPPAQ